MKEIYNLISDGVLANELASGLRNRKLEQKFLYLNKWWDHYYNFKEADKVDEESNFTAEDLIEIWIKWNGLFGFESKVYIREGRYLSCTKSQ